MKGRNDHLPPVGMSDCASLPVIYVRGTHYQVGFETGRLMKENIRAFYNGFAALHEKFLPFTKTDKGRRIFEEYFNVVKNVLPQYLEEIRGLSDGSDVPFEQVFLMHIRSEISLVMRQGDYEAPACTTVFVNRADVEIVGHNEDNDPGMLGHSYLVSAEILAGDGTVKEKFTAFAYPGTIPGNAFSFNRAGVIFTVNAVSPLTVPTEKIPRYILNRAFLSAESPEDLERIINMRPGLAHGCSLNVVFTKHPNEPCKMRNYEFLGFQGEVSGCNSTHTHVDVATTFLYNPCKPEEEGNGFMYHFNKYERMKVKQNPEHFESSVCRQKRSKELPVPKTIQDVLTFLGDTADEDYPVYRKTGEKDDLCTIATVLFDLKEMTMAVYRGNPKATPPLIILPIPSSSGDSI